MSPLLLVLVVLACSLLLELLGLWRARRTAIPQASTSSVTLASLLKNFYQVHPVKVAEQAFLEGKLELEQYEKILDIHYGLRTYEEVVAEDEIQESTRQAS